MKKSIFLTLISLSIIGCKQKVEKEDAQPAAAIATVKSEPSFELLWETDTIFKTPESCFYDKKHQVIYVSNVNNAPRTKDNNGYISVLALDGHVIKEEWASDLSAPKGMDFYEEVLYVSDIDAVVEINAHTGMVMKRHTLEGALMLNDISIDKKTGVLYVTDMDTGKIHTLINGEFTTWKEGLVRPNGLLVDGNSLLLASNGQESLISYDLTTKAQKEVIASGVGKADGVVKLNSGNYVVSDWRGEIFKTKDHKATSVFNTLEDKKAQTADIGIIDGKDIILVPTFFGNKVKAFKLTE